MHFLLRLGRIYRKGTKRTNQRRVWLLEQTMRIP